MLQVKH